MKKYQFTSKNGIDVTINVAGSYTDGGKDFDVEASNGYESLFEEVCDANEILDALEENGIEFDANPRHFNELVIDSCMIIGDTTLDEALDRQAKWEDGQ